MSSRLQRAPLLPAILVSCAGILLADAPPAQKPSPFLPPAGATTLAAKSAAGTYELVGMTVAGKDTFLSILRVSDQRSTWIPVGKTIGEITVVRYDPATDQAVIHAEGKDLTLTLRQAQITPLASTTATVQPVAASPLLSSATLPPTAIASPSAPVKMPPLSPQEEKEMEARMLVTDLLEIGQRQRAAYQEAQREAARRAAETKSSATAASTTAKP